MGIESRRKVAFGVAFALLLGIGAAAIFQTLAWESSARAVAQTHQVLARLDELALHSKGAEEAARTADAARFTRETSIERRIALDIQELSADNPDRKPKIDTLLRLTGEQASALNRAPASPEYDRAAGVRVQSAVAAMQAGERQALAGQMGMQGDVAVRTRELFEAAGFVSVLLIGLAAWLVSGDMKKRAAVERALVARGEQYRQVVELAGDIIYRTDHLGRFTFCNRTALTMLHLTEREVIGRSYLKMIRQDKRKDAERFYLRQFARRRKNSYYEFPVIDGHGRERWLGQNVQLLTEGDGIAGFQAIAREITERKRAEDELQKSRAFVARIAATTPGILYVYDLDLNRNVYVNKEALSVLGYRPEEIEQHDVVSKRYLHPDDVPALRGHYEALRNVPDGEVRRIEFRAKHADGSWIWLASRDTPFERGRDGLVKQVVGIAQDITERKAAQDKLAYQANFDALTGLANRHHFWTRLQTVVRRTSIEHSTVSLCILDVDQFKRINDSHGHAVGDEVLESLGSIIRGELRVKDVAGRLGGDEFCFALPEMNVHEAARVSERIRERISTMAFGMASGGAPFSVTATFGLAEWQPHMDAKELIEAADRALYRAKSAGRNRVCVDV